MYLTAAEIRDQRNKQGLTQKQFLKLIGYKETFSGELLFIEHDDQTPSTEFVEAFWKTFPDFKRQTFTVQKRWRWVVDGESYSEGPYYNEKKFDNSYESESEAIQDLQNFINEKQERRFNCWELESYIYISEDK